MVVDERRLIWASAVMVDGDGLVGWAMGARVSSVKYPY
jgi:hypothetical protein